MNKHLRKILLILSGQTGVHLVTIAALSGVLALYGYAVLFITEMIIGVMAIRVIFYLTRGPKPVLSAYLVRKKAGWLVEDEIKISMALAAACFVLQLPVNIFPFCLFVIINFTTQLAMMFLSKLALKTLSKNINKSGQTKNAKQVLIIGTGARAKKATDVILDSPELETYIIGFLDYRKKDLWRYRDIPLIGHPESAQKIIANFQVDAVLIAVEPEDLSQTRLLFNTAEKMGVPVCFMLDIYEPSISRVKPAYINGTPVLLYRAVPDNQFRLFTKSMLDKAAALIGLILTLPIMLITSIAIKLDSKGPVLFKQVRSGLNGKLFNFYKFRTMCYDAEKKKSNLSKLNEMSGPVFKINNDPRVTRVGRILRKTSIDEIPQFINILKGDMSLVGPRPPLPKEVAQYKPWQRRKLSVKPGVTCIWQVGGRNNIDFEEWMKLDLQYIDNWSLWQDAKIIAKTIPAVFKGVGAS